MMSLSQEYVTENEVMTNWTEVKKYDKRHGGPFDRGQADSYYRRPRNPHYFRGATYMTTEIKEALMKPEEIEAYHAGYDENEEAGCFKGYGDY